MNFSFGATNPQTTQANTGFGFGQPQQQQQQQQQKSFTFGNTSGGGFSFGTPATSASTYNFGTPATSTISGYAFGNPTTSATPAYSFGTPLATTTAANTGFSFGAPAQPAAFGFGTPQKTAASTGFSFGTQAAGTTPQSTGGFGFAQPQAPAASTGFAMGTAVAPTTGFSAFGAAPNMTAGSGFGFGQTPAATTTTAATGLSFGTGMTSTPNTGSMFGATPATTAAAPMFGAMPAQSTTFGFGAPSVPAQPAAPAFGFGTSITPSVTTSGLTFGTSSATTGGTLGTTPFGSIQPVSTTSSLPAFGFGAASAVTQPTVAAVAPQAPAFGAAVPKTTGFQFGAINPPASSAPAPIIGGFAFQPTATTTAPAMASPFQLTTTTTATTAASQPLGFGLAPTAVTTASVAPLTFGQTTQPTEAGDAATIASMPSLTSMQAKTDAPATLTSATTLVPSTTASTITTSETQAKVPGFSFGVTTAVTSTATTSTSAFPVPAAKTTASAPFPTSSTTALSTPSTSFMFGSATTTSLASSTATVPSGQAVLSTTTAVTPASAAAPTSINFRQMEDMINKWKIELDDQEKEFLNQATQVNAWDRLLMNNAEKITSLNDAVERVKLDQQRLDNELGFITTQQAELEELLLPLEHSIESVPAASIQQHADLEREHTYHLAENIDSQLKRMAEDIKEIIEHVNSANKSHDNNDPVQQIAKILNAHMDALQWIDQNTVQLQRKLEETAKICESQQRESETLLR